MNRKILCVDDDPNVLTGVQRNARRQFDLDVALGGAEALKTMAEKGPYAVVVADMRMPVMDGLELLIEIQKRHPDTIRVMLTGNAEQRTAVDAVNSGHVFRFLNKPCQFEDLAVVLEAGIQQYNFQVAERELLENTLGGAVKVLTEILAATEPDLYGHAQKVSDYARIYARNNPAPKPWELEMAATLAPIGYVTVPPDVIKRAQNGVTVSAAEEEMLERMPETGAKLLANIPRLEGVAEMVLHHQKRFDGGGFPRDTPGGDKIPLGARILRVLSDLVLVESRGLASEKALTLLQSRTGIYDPRILEAARNCLSSSTPAEAVPGEEKTLIPFKNLAPGQSLLSNVETEDGVLIVSAGTCITPILLAKLRNFNRLSHIKEPIYVAIPSSQANFRK